VLRRRAVNRAAESIVSNIVEGCAASSRKEFARFLDISIKSTSEVDYQLQLARDLGVLRHAQWKPLAQEVVELRKMLSALRRTVLDAAQFRTRPGDDPRRSSHEAGRGYGTRWLVNETRGSGPQY
jgi:four helix bundle protein